MTEHAPPDSAKGLAARYAAGERAFSRGALAQADLSGMRLCGIDLREADLASAKLVDADLRDADLRGANLESADLTGASLRDANLQGVDLRRTVGLTTADLGGANLANARVPDGLAFSGLERVEGTIQSVQRLFLLMLAGCGYSVLTIWATTDDKLLTDFSTSTLPIVGVAVPIVDFYWVAPLVLAGVYLYLNVRLQHLWDGLAPLPSVFPDGLRLDQKVDPWLLNGWVRAHFRWLRADRTPVDRLETLIAALLVWCLVPLTLLLFWARYLPRHHWVVSTIQVTLLVLTIGGGVLLNRLAVATLRGWRWGRLSWRCRDGRAGAVMGSAVTAVVLLAVTFLAIEGRPARGASQSLQTLVPSLMEFVKESGPFADLREKQLSTRPASWKIADGPAGVTGIQLRAGDLRHAVARDAFLVKANLEGAKLNHADLQRARLIEANLENAHLDGADLKEADLRSAVLRGATLRETKLEEANLQAADLRYADLTGATLRRARLDETVLPWQRDRHPWQRDVPMRVLLQGATLVRADMQEAQCQRADLSYANLREADLRGADLSKADLREVVLSGAKLEKVNLDGAKLEGANLSGADLRDAYCLTPEQLGVAITDSRTTRLPERFPTTCPRPEQSGARSP